MREEQPTIRRATPDDATLLADLSARTFYDAFARDNKPEDMDRYVAGAFNVDQMTRELVDPRATFATPVNFRPSEWGFDLSLHSATKYLNGHSDIVAGAIIGRGDLVGKAGKKLKYFRGTLDPHACFLLHRGLKTLALRVRHQNEAALRLARFLDAHPLVNTVNYPGLDTHPQHARARTLFDGFGGMLSLDVEGGREGAERFMQHLTIPILAPSLGGVETLATRPAISSHAELTPEARAHMGITDGLIRVLVGIVAVDDLLEDFEQALGTLETVTL